MKRNYLALSIALALVTGLSCDRATAPPTTGGIDIVLLSGSQAVLSVAPRPAGSNVDLSVLSDNPLNVLLDGVRVTVSGPTNKTVTVTTATGTNFDVTVDGLLPGTYTVVVEGLVQGKVAHYGELANVSVTAGASTPASVTFPVFQPAVPNVTATDTVDVLHFTVSYGAVPNATSYVVEWSTSSTMTNPQSKSVTGTSTDVTVTAEGTYYYTVRAVNSAVGATGLPSPAKPVFVFQGVATVTVTPASPTIAYGATQQMTAEGRDGDNNVVPNVSWVWISSVQSVGTVSPTGLVTAVGPGQTSITAVGKGMPGNTTLTVNPPPGTKLAFTVPPTTATAGASIAAVKVAVQNVLNQTITTDNTTQITVAIGTNAGSGTLSGTATATVVAGVATFSSLSINRTGVGYTLTAAANALTGATSSTFDITAGAATKLVFGIQPPNGTMGDALSPAVQVEVQDANSNLISSARNAITVAIGTNPGTATLAGTNVVNAVGGIATFSNLSLNNAGTGYTLTAAAAGLTGATSAAFNVAASGAATQLAFTVQPSSVTADDFIAPAVKVAVRDAAGRTVTTDNSTQVTMAIGTNPNSGTLSGTLTATAASGVATFSDLGIDNAGTGYTLKATTTSLTSATSTAFNITAGAASQIFFSIEPTNAVAGDPVSPAIQVEFADWAGNRVLSMRDEVTIAIANNPSIGQAGVLTGTKKVNAIDGIASFTGLWINKTGTDYTLSASSGGLPGATSAGFTISPAAPAKLAFSQQPTNVQGNTVIAPAVTVTITDQFDNATTATNQVTMAIGENPWKTPFATGGTISGTLQANAVAGVATFSNLKIDKPSPGYTLSASSGTLSTASSSTFNVNLTFSQISSGGSHTCGITPAASYCWGANGSGQLGATTGSANRDSIPALVKGGLTFTVVSAAANHTCAITSANDAYCWGYNGSGQLGNGSFTSTGPTGQPVAVSGGLKFASIKAGENHTCGITTSSVTASIDRQVYCWGYSYYGQLGNGVSGGAESNIPVRVNEPLQTTTRAASLALGTYHTCAVALNNNAYCWGYDGNGQLGDDAPLVDKNVPTIVAGGLSFLSITAGYQHTCGIISVPATDTPARCWGYNYYGQLGDNTALISGGQGTNQPTPVAVFGNLNYSTISAGFYFTCAVTTGGAGYCWGNNNVGQLGDDLLGTNTSQRSAVAGGLTFLTIQSGNTHACGRTASAVYCWGSNSQGQGGTAGVGVNKRVPAQIVQ